MSRIRITTGSNVPIYRQIVDQLRQAVATGQLKVGEAAPSVRGLAKELLVNPNTVAKAYAELVRDGVFESQRGRGFFAAAPRNVFSAKERRRRLVQLLDPFLAEALTLGFDADQIQNEVAKRLEQMTKVKH
ncbi:UNVERIFIED_CONTAM: hypothetical protein GTU68_031690 [Idotea baltica]|nr:hypothetical protein [Idotea baltica]